MNFITIEESKFRQFANQSPYRSFMQTPEIAKLRAKDGWTTYYVAVTKGQNILAAAMLMGKTTFLGKSTFIAPGGPLIDLSDQKLTTFFFKHLKSFVKSHHGYTLHISPNFELIKRDRDGQPVEGGFNHQEALGTLKKLGFRPAKHSDQPKYLFALSLEGRTPEQLFADFKNNTRNLTRRTERLGVKVRELKKSELSIFKQITEDTSKRRHFTDRPLSYYEQMYDLFHDRGEVKFILAEKDHTPLSAAMFMLYGDEVVYLFSGSDEKYMKEYNAQYAIQWYMIQHAVKNHFKRYNFYGIIGLPDQAHPDGIYTFKRGFTSPSSGYVIELIGSFNLPITSHFYLHQAMSCIKGLLHR